MNQHDRQKHSIRFWLIIAAVVITPIVMLILYRMSCQSEFDRRVEAIREQGFPVSIDDLEKDYTLPEGVENAADIYLLAFQYQQKPTAEEIDLIPLAGKYENEPPFPQEVIDALGSYLQRNQKTLDLFEKAAQTEYCLWPKTRNQLGLYNDNLSEIINATRLLMEQNLYLAQQGDTDKLFNSIQTAISLSKTLSKQPLLIDLLVSLSIKRQCADNLEDVLIQADFTESQLMKLQNRFAMMQDTEAFYEALINERCDIIEFWQLPPDQQAQADFSSPSKTDQILYSVTGCKLQDALTSLDSMGKNIAAAKLPLYMRYEAFMQNEINDDPGIFSFKHLHLGSVTSFTRLIEPDLGTIGILKGVETALAIERYRKQHNSIPDSLEALVPNFLAELPRDPFDNETLRYIKLDKGFTLYSIGKDIVDNGGLSREQLKKQTGKQPEQYDWPFTVKWQ
ncbi:MAG: hypothetical protein KAS23_07500 [Anaerohalosphaera sp.]|nr:hypothetical protein [Anaerohalosphaera sp.]